MGKTEGNGVDFAINGQHYNVDPSKDKMSGESRLVDYIRDQAGLKGTKLMCREGGCGACVVTVRTKDPTTGEETTKAVNSCLTPVYSCDGWDISTVESVGNRQQGYHTIQKRLAKFNGTQCGYCSPGMVMSMYSLLESKPEITVKDVEDNFDGNICRCTGYRPILDAFKSFAVDAPEEIRKQCTGDIEDCAQCPARNGNVANESCSKENDKTPSGKTRCQLARLLAHKQSTSENILKLQSGEEWIQVNDVKSVVATLERLNKAGLKYRIVAGNTGTGVYKHDGPYDAFVNVNGIPELTKSTLDTAGVVFGGGVNLTSAIALLKKASALEGYKYTADMGKHLERVANVPVRNAGTLAGNLMMKHAHKEFQSDVFVILETVGAKINIAMPSGGPKMFTLIEFLGLDMKGKLIVSIYLPQRKNGYVYRSYKITRRFQNTHAYVNAGFLLKVDPTQNYKVLEKPRIVFGGISAEFSHASNTELFLLDKCLGDESTLTGALIALDKEVHPDLRPAEATVEYRKDLTKSLLYKTILGIVSEKVSPAKKSGKLDLIKLISKGMQTFDKDDGDTALYKEVPKVEALKQASGEAEYTGDIPFRPDELFAVFVGSTVANGTLKSIDASEALKMPGVARFISASDIPGKNTYAMENGFFPVVQDEPVFAKDKISHYAQPLGLILADTREIATAAAKKVVVTYENVEKPAIDLVETIKKLDSGGMLEKFKLGTFSSPDQPTDSTPPKNSVKGEFRVGSQYHFHMETHVTVCHPTEEGMDVYAAAQWMELIQSVVSTAVNLPSNNINVYVRRVGGGFGAKIARGAIVTAACAIAAQVTRRPVRIVLDMETNMNMIGRRPNYLLKYDAGFDDSGKINKLNFQIFGDVGWSLNEPIPIVVAIHIQSAYAAVGWDVTPYSIPTNTPANTAVRAPGSPQAILLIETVMEHIAKNLGKDPLEVRAANYWKPGDSRLQLMPSPHEMKGENLIPAMIEEIKKTGDYEQRKDFIEKFNKENRWRKRGMSLVPVGYPLEYMNGANFPVQVLIYQKDGTVAVSHGGIEMGQGINTKVAQTVSHILKVPVDKIQIKRSDNFVGGNSFCSGGSVASELCCDGAMKASQMLVERMKPIKDKMDNPTWEELVTECSKKSVNLMAQYMHSSDDDCKPYLIWLVNLTEVEVDILTGEYKVVRCDLIEDAGKSLSPGVDLGQIEGGHIFGQGLFTTEKLVFDHSNGKLLTDNTWEYKPPETKDIPEDFRITLLKNAPNPYGVLRSKATGEPVLCGSCSVVFALRNAISAARKDAGNDDWFDIETPVTQEDVIRLSLTSSKQYGF